MEGSTVITSTAWQSVLTALQTQLSVSTVVEVLAVVTGAAVGLVFMWWGVRKTAKVLMAAFRKGKLSI